MISTPKNTEAETGHQKALFDDGGNHDVLAELANFFDFSKDEIEEHTRRQQVVEARHMIMYLLREYGGMSFPAIGRLIGKRDHTTVIHAYNKTKQEVTDDPTLLESLAGPISLVEALRVRKQKVEEEIREMNARLYAEAMANIRLTREKRKSPRIRTIPDRDMKILEMYREGLTLKNISDIFGVSRERIRQVVLTTIQYLAINESITNGIVMDVDVLLEEESKKRKMVQDSKKPAKPPKAKDKRWSIYYDACRECGSTVYKHVRQGYCERCLGAYRGEVREKIIVEHSSRCDICHISRPEAIRTYGRDLYIKKDKTVLCKKHFLADSAQKMGHYKHFDWSRHYDACKKCGTTTIPHARGGLCVNCSSSLTNEQREQIIIDHHGKCDQCGLRRAEQRTRYHSDFRITNQKKVLCTHCFNKGLGSRRSKPARTRLN